MSEEKSLRLLKIYEDLIKGLGGTDNAETFPKVSSCLERIDDEITEDVLLDLILADEEALNKSASLDIEETSRSSFLFSPLTHDLLEEISLDLLLDDEDIFTEADDRGALSPLHVSLHLDSTGTSSNSNSFSPAINLEVSTSSLDLFQTYEALVKSSILDNKPNTKKLCATSADFEIFSGNSSDSSKVSENVEKNLDSWEPVKMPPISPEEFARYTHNKNPLACKICDKEFSKKANLKTHYLLHAGIKPYICEICFRKFTRNTALAVHSLIHSGERNHLCNVCDKLFARIDDLIKHKRIHTGEKPYLCGTCGKSFSHQNNLRRHRLRHKSIKRFNCKLCNEAFLDKDVLLSHLKSHLMKGVTKGKPDTSQSNCRVDNEIEEKIRAKLHCCDVCGHLFNRRDRLLRHKLIHENVHRCEVCDAKFKHKDSLQSHLLSHVDLHLEDFDSQMSEVEDLSPISETDNAALNSSASKVKKMLHTCDICFKAFSRKTLLNRHRLVHTGEKPHKCHVCQRRFSQKITLQRHIATHTGEKPFVCNICQKSFSRKMHLQKHYATHSAKKLF